MAICCFAIYANYPAFTATTGKRQQGPGNMKAKRCQSKSGWQATTTWPQTRSQGKMQVAYNAAVVLCIQHVC